MPRNLEALKVSKRSVQFM